nr:hypothetical protein [Tanacetum cinerariifolium]
MEGEDTSQPPPPIASKESPRWCYLSYKKDEAGNEVEVPPVIAQQILARTREKKAKSTLLMAIPDEHLARFHVIKDAKTLWVAIKTRFGGNAESKKMQKNILKQQFKNFSVSNSEGLDRGYDRFQRLLNLLEIHGAGVSIEDVNQKFLRSLPSAWSNISLIMRNKPGNVAFVSAESTNSTNELNYAYNVSTATGHSSQAQGSSSYANELMFLFFANQSSSPQLDNEDLEQIDQDDLEEMDLKWQVAMLSIRVKRFYKKTGRKLEFNGKEQVGLIKPRSRDARNAGYIEKNNGKRPAKEEDENALVVQDGLGTHDWSYQVEEKANDFALMAFTSNPSSSSSSNSETVFDNRSSDEENSLVNARFKKGEGYHAVPPPLTRNYMPPKSDLSFAGLDDSIYKFKINKPKEDRSSAPLIQDWDTDRDNDSVFSPEHIPAKITFVKADKMAKKYVLPNHVGKETGHKECRPVWNNVQRINHQNKFASTTVLTRFGRMSVSAAKPKVAASTSAAKPVNTDGPKQSVHFSKSRISVVKRNRVTAIKTSAGCVWRPRVNAIDHISKDNRALVTKSHNKTSYELLNGRTPRLDFMRPFGCPVTVLNTLDHLEKFKGKADEGFLVGYSVTRNQTDKNAGLQDTNCNASTPDNVDAGKEVFDQHYIVLPLWSSISSTFKSSNDKAADDKPKDDIGSKTIEEPVNKKDQAYRDKLDRLMSQEKEASDAADALRKEFEQGCMDKKGATKAGSTNPVNTVSNLVNAASTSGTFSVGGPSSPYPDTFIFANTLLHVDQDDYQIPDLEDTPEHRITGIFNRTYDDDLDIFTSLVQSVGAEADFNNIDSSIVVGPIPTHRVHIDHPKIQILGDPKSVVQTKGMAKKSSGAHAFVSYIHKQRRTNHKDYENYLFACFLSQMKPKKNRRYVSQPPGFIDSQFPNKVYKIEKALYGLHQAPRAWYETLSTFLLQNRYRRGTIDKTLFIQKDKDDIILVQVYVDDIIFRSTKKSLCDEFEVLMHKRFQMSSMGELTFFLGLQVKQTSTPIETQKPLVKDVDTADVDVHVTPKLSHLHAVKWIFRYLKGQPKLGLWYPKDSLFDLEAYSDNDYAGANLDRKSTTRGCQFLGRRLISWQYNKQTIVATSTTKAEYVAAVNYCGQVLWIQNQMLDYGFNFMNTKIYIDNESIICIVKNLVYH